MTQNEMWAKHQSLLPEMIMMPDANGTYKTYYPIHPSHEQIKDEKCVLFSYSRVKQSWDKAFNRFIKLSDVWLMSPRSAMDLSMLMIKIDKYCWPFSENKELSKAAYKQSPGNKVYAQPLPLP